MERNANCYSVHRHFAFHEYCQPASPWRVLFVSCVYGMSALMVLLLIEAVPLQDPSEGWRGNGAYWLRTMFSMTCFYNSAS
uniref:Uncharacterized protein n=1 Tax=Globisporangium ultimum (strain ATCC 200006 / CBS 805.95 / DAOM BR144) TaxID=431595 RepID=K3WJA6_GLOUD